MERSVHLYLLPLRLAVVVVMAVMKITFRWRRSQRQQLGRAEKPISHQTNNSNTATGIAIVTTVTKSTFWRCLLYVVGLRIERVRPNVWRCRSWTGDDEERRSILVGPSWYASIWDTPLAAPILFFSRPPSFWMAAPPLPLLRRWRRRRRRPSEAANPVAEKGFSLFGVYFILNLCLAS